MNTFFRNCLLLIAVVFFLSVSDHVLYILAPYLLREGGKTIAKTYKTVCDMRKLTHDL